MTDLSRIDSDDEQGDAWLDAYPPQHRAMLEKYGVPTWMNQRADAHNRRLIAVVDAGCSEEAELAALAEQSFDEHFGDTLADWAAEAATARGDDAARHVDLNAADQVSVANGIGHVMTRFRRREVAALAGFTVNAAGDVRLFGGGRTEEQNWVLGAEFLSSKEGLAQIVDMPAPAADPITAVTLSPGVVHTRNAEEQQAAVAAAVREVRRRYRDGEIQMAIGITVDHLGRMHPFGGGETDGRLVEAAIDVLKKFISQFAEKRYDQ